MPISPDIFDTEEQEKTERKQGMIGMMGTMFVRNLKSAINEIAGKSVFKVKVEGSEQEAILKKILGLLHSISAYSKMSSNGQNPSQKISIKTTDLVTLNKSIEDILKKIEAKPLIVKVPEISKVQGTVKVENFPKEYDFDKLGSLLSEIKQTLGNIRLEVPPQREIKFPEMKMPDFPKTMGVPGIKEMIALLKDVKESLDKLPKKIEKAEFPSQIAVSNFPPTKYPMPVTNININPLRGFVHSTAVTVTASLTPLPGEVLSNRRSIIIFNNDATTTVYIGGSEMSASDGLPVLAQTYSPVIDAGPRMIIYGMTASGSVNVRVLEASNEAIGG